MKNNNGKGLYDIGETNILACGCKVVAEVVGYTHYVNPDCPFDNKIHPKLKNYTFVLNSKK